MHIQVVASSGSLSAPEALPPVVCHPYSGQIARLHPSDHPRSAYFLSDSRKASDFDVKRSRETDDTVVIDSSMTLASLLPSEAALNSFPDAVL